MVNNFKSGDKVICIDNNDFEDELIINKSYEIFDVDRYGVNLVGYYRYYYCLRFELDIIGTIKNNRIKKLKKLRIK